MTFEQRYVQARRRFIEADFANLNDMQRKAVLATEGPLLLLAGAGSGKTTVLIHRIANLIQYGRGSDTDEVPDTATEADLALLERTDLTPDERRRAQRAAALEPVEPWRIIAITFTNKAADELKDRIERMLGPEAAADIWASTFHSACVRILRRDADKLGYPNSFTIYDTSDSQAVVKRILKEMNLDEKAFPYRAVLTEISRAKDSGITPEQYLARAQATHNPRSIRIGEVYQTYWQRLFSAGAMDFDDLIYNTVRLLDEHEDVREHWQRRFRYVLIDEYQDTNNLQYQLAALLADGWGNICVVGDDDQSIYKFRGATIENILNFEKQYKNARTIRLEQNYRSTGRILDAANHVIANNTGRKGKTLWTKAEAGDPLTLYCATNENDEARYVATKIMDDFGHGMNFRDHAVLYRMNAQSNQLEYAFKRNGIPYRIIGGTRFFDRAEVKDMLAYLCLINNRADDLRLRRIINQPPRGIGGKTLEVIERQSAAEGRPLYSVLCNARSYPALERAEGKLQQFAELIESCAELSRTMPLPEFYDELLIRTGYAAMLEQKGDVESRTRLENVRELRSSILTYLENADAPSLSGFLEEIALYTDIEQYDRTADAVVMMTVHSAKGLEFPEVYLVGAEDGLFPSARAIGEPEEMEEERRLCYVAMTRAREKLTLTNARQRTLYGRTTPCMPSRFLNEIPEENMEWLSKPQPRSESWEERDSDYGDRGYGSSYGGYGQRSAAPVVTRREPAEPKAGALRSAAGASKAAPKAAAPRMQIQAGETVEHDAFGRGLVLSVRAMGGDALVEVAFDSVGTKKLMLKMAAQHLKIV